MDKKKLFLHGGTSILAKYLVKKLQDEYDEFYIFCTDIERAKINLNIINYEDKKFVFFENNLKDLNQTSEDINKLPNDLHSVVWLTGYTGDPDKEFLDYQSATDNININYLHVVLSLTSLVKKIKFNKNNFICVFTAVAGLRGRNKKLYYGSEKAGLINFLSALRQKYSNKINVLTVIPGYVDTNAFKKLKLNPNKILISTPEKCASIVYRSIKLKKEIVYINFFWRIIMKIINLIPEKIFKRLKF